MMPKTGDWNELNRFLKEISDPAKLGRHLKSATEANAIEAQGAIKTGIRNQWPDWEPLAESTIKRKLAAGRHKSAAGIKILIDTGQLLNNIAWKVYDPFKAAVGVMKGAKRKDGEDLVNVAAVHEYGSRDGRIPSRPYLSRAVRRLEKKFVDRWAKAVTKTWRNW